MFTYTEDEFYQNFGYTYAELECFESTLNDMGWIISSDLYNALNDAMWGENDEDQIIFPLVSYDGEQGFDLHITKGNIKTDFREFRNLQAVIDLITAIS